ncbi:MAG: geranylgeranyl reductase family protein [bacterium]|nr:geranylgeranyl reductase family protein [bacterium]
MNSKQEFEVVVIGGGPAGAIAGRYAALRGARVLLLEQKKKIGIPIRCGEFFPTAEELEKIFVRSQLVPELYHIRDDLIAQRIEIVRVYSPKGSSFDMPLKGHSVYRDRFEQHLLEEAAKAGVTIQMDSRVDKVQNGAVYAKGRIFRPQVIILACGPNRNLLNPLGISVQKDIAICVQYLMENVKIEPRVVEMYYGNVSPGGYAWVIPKGGDRANIGLGIRRRFYDQNILKLLDEFIQSPSMINKTACGRKISTIAGLVPVNGPVRKTVIGNIILVGDAAGHVMATNGGGIPTAMICGRIAGEVSADHVRQDRPLEDYEKQWKRECGREFANALHTRKRADFVIYRLGWAAEILMRLVGPRVISRALKCAFVGP